MAEESNMWFFHRKKREQQLRAKDAQVKAIHRDTLKKIGVAAKKTEKLNDLLEENEGITELIFLATGGERRIRRK
jgi:hypothetical protein